MPTTIVVAMNRQRSCRPSTAVNPSQHQTTEGGDQREQDTGARARHPESENERDIGKETGGQSEPALRSTVDQEAHQPRRGDRYETIEQCRVVVAVGEETDAVARVGDRIKAKRAVSPCIN